MTDCHAIASGRRRAESARFLRAQAPAFCAGLLVSVALVSASWAGNVGPAAPPNLIVVLTDDLSVDLLDALLASGYAPNIQRYLVDEGVEFSNSFVTNSLCCPSRVTLLRGQYSHNHGVLANRTQTLEAEVKPGIAWPGWLTNGEEVGKESSTIATWLQAVGYRTAHVGRYLNGYGTCGPHGVCIDANGELPPGAEDPRLHRPPGWDSWQTLVDPTTFSVYDYDLNDNGTIVAYGSAAADYQTDVLAGYATQFIEAQAGDPGSPFFLAVDTFAPHIERNGEAGESRFDLSIRPAPRHVHLIDGDTTNGELLPPESSPAFDEEDMSDKPTCPDVTSRAGGQCVADLPPIGPAEIPKLEHQMKSMMASVIAVDDLIGAMMTTLESHQLAGETVLVLTSDNGWMYGEHRAAGKELAYEESIRVPLLVRGPGFVAGVRIGAVVLNTDLAPTLVELSQAQAPYELDGRSLLPLLEAPQNATWLRNGFLVEHWYVPNEGFARYMALRYKSVTKDFLYAVTFTTPGEPEVSVSEFYHLKSDPYQLQSIAFDPVPPFLTEYLSKLRKCAGLVCRHLENIALP